MTYDSKVTRAGASPSPNLMNFANQNRSCLVILSAAKYLGVRPGRPFAALRVTLPALKGKIRHGIGRPRRNRVGAGLAPALESQSLAPALVPPQLVRALFNTLMTYVTVCMFALLLTSCSWPGAQQTAQPDARLQLFRVHSARIIMLDTQAEVDGTLQNTSHTDRFPYDVTVIATFYNRAGNVVGQAGGVAEDVYPGMSRPFILVGQVDSTQYSHMVVTVISLKERRIEKIIPTPSVVP